MVTNDCRIRDRVMMAEIMAKTKVLFSVSIYSTNAAHFNTTAGAYYMAS